MLLRVIFLCIFFCLNLLSFINLQVAIFHQIWKEFDLSFFLSSFVFSFFTSFFFLSFLYHFFFLSSFHTSSLPPFLPFFTFVPSCLNLSPHFLEFQLQNIIPLDVLQQVTEAPFIFSQLKKNCSWVVSTDFCVNSLFFSAAFCLLLSLSREIFSDILFFSYRNLILFFLTIFISLLIVLICSFIMSI